MKNTPILPGRSFRHFCLLFFALSGITSLKAAPEDVDLTGASPNAEFEFQLGMGAIPAGTGFGVVNAVGDVFWEFASIPAGATGVTSTAFTINGITVTIPNSSGGAVSNALTATIEGTPSNPKQALYDDHKPRYGYRAGHGPVGKYGNQYQRGHYPLAGA